jgi:uncharacterized protein
MSESITLQAYKEIKHKNYNEAIRILKPLADKNSEYALLSLGWIYDQATNTESSKSLAREYYRRASMLGCNDADYHLGWHFYDNSDHVAAKNAFSAGASNHHLGCMSMLGKILIEDSKSTSDIQEGLFWIKKAASEGHFFAKRKLFSIELQNTASFWKRILIRTRIIFLAKKGMKEYLKDPNSDKIF